ncbi:unnamed protein product [Linum tenue]|uniref:TIR domain-containing protein n=1 Tax=Linum tenue TaxID=586396 RepID=A0AAV0K7L2_9ROSI|nr:unnamed protein product [Linum tenue]
MDCCFCGIRACAKVILAPICIPYKLCCGSKSNTSPQHPHVPSPISKQPSISSLSKSSLPKGNYEVFLNFRGPDTRHQFTGFLFNTLDNVKIRTFMDDNDLYQGEEIGPSLVKSIEQSKIYVVILSANYAESKWCLRELAKIVECRERDKRHIILPIFYLVDPFDVKHQAGPYEKAFQQHERNCAPEIVQSWRKALELVGRLSGWHVKRTDQHKDTLDGVFKTILAVIRRNDNLLDTSDLVGIDEHVKAITEKLSLESPDLTMVGIHGFGGIGKTTIARTVYHKLGDEFERQCFLQNIREKQEVDKDAAIELQKTLISSVMMRKDFTISINSVEEGRKLIEDRVTPFIILIVLDDVDEKFNFKEVLGDLENFARGSRFIITSRNIKVLSSFNKNKCKLYEVGPLNRQLSLQLFCKHAFGEDGPQSGFETLAKKIVKKINGVPLVLEVIGKSLSKEEKSFWEGTLAQIEKIPPKEIIQTLRISYEQLDYQAQQIFLDIACLYIGENKDLASYMWSDIGFYPDKEIPLLIHRSLIKIGDDNKFQVHDQLRDMGRAIVREESFEHPWMRSRVWNKKEAVELLQYKKGSINVKALNLEDEYETGKLTCEYFQNLSELRYFEAHGVAFEGDFNEILPNIRSLCLREHKNEGCYPTNFQMRNLVTLDLEDSWDLKSDWGGWSQLKTANKLKFLNLSGCSSLTRLPDLPRSGSLEGINLSKVSNLDPDVELNVGGLWNLKQLYLNDVKLKRISGGTIGTMKKLKVLDVSDLECENLEEVLADIAELSSLETLTTTKPLTDELQDIDDLTPSDIEEILKIMKPEDESDGKEAVPLGQLPTSLKRLRTSSPVVNLSELLKLKVLTVQDCYDPKLQIPSVEDSWWKESKLKHITLINTNIDIASSSSPLPRLPSSLEFLIIWDCLESKWLPTLENLENLIELGIIECGHLQEIQGLEKLLQCNNLKSLQIASCPKLTSTFRRGGRFVNSSLQELCLRNCGGSIPRLSNFPSLKELEIGKIIGEASEQEMESRLEEIAGLGELQDLKLYELKLVERLPSLSTLQNLSLVAIIDMPRLREIQGLADLKWLERLVLAGCTALEGLKLPAANLKLLQELDIRGCQKLPSGDLDALRASYPPGNHVKIKWPDEDYEAGEGLPSSSRLFNSEDSSAST